MPCSEVKVFGNVVTGSIELGMQAQQPQRGERLNGGCIHATQAICGMYSRWGEGKGTWLGVGWVVAVTMS